MLDNPMWQEKFCQMTHRAWWEKDIMTHVLIVYPTLGNSFFGVALYYLGIDLEFPLCYSH
jgi:hypothetical protein